MHIQEYMNTNVITVDRDTLVSEAERIMRENHIRRLPVLYKGKLVGLITRNKLREATISPATTLTVWELNYLVSKLKVKDIMETRLVKLTPDMTLEQAINIIQDQKVGTLPVVDTKDPTSLVGIITAADLLRIIATIFGFGEKGTRLYFIEPSHAGGYEALLRLIIDSGAQIRSSFKVKASDFDKESCIIHLDQEDATDIVEQIQEKGYQIEAQPR